MSVVIMTAVWQHSDSKGSTRLVLLSLADQANDEGYCWPSVGSIARRCRISERSVQMHLHALENELHEVERAERSGRSTMYRVTVSEGGAKSAPPQDLHPANVAPGGEARFGGGVKPASPRTVIEPSPNPQKSRAKGSRLSPDWLPSPAVRSQMAQERPDVDLKAEHLKFVDHWTSKTGRDATKLDWDATWRNWIRNARGPQGSVRPVQAVPAYVERPVPDRDSLPWAEAGA